MKRVSGGRIEGRPWVTVPCTGGRTVRLELSSASVVRVTVCAAESRNSGMDFAIVRRTISPVRPTLSRTRQSATVSTPLLTVSVNRRTAAVSFRDSTGRLLLGEGGWSRRFTAAHILGERTFHISTRFHFARQEAVYGFGQHQNGVVDYRGRKVTLAQTNMEVGVPVFVSDKGYGILWDNCSETRFDDTAGNGEIWSDVGEAIDYYFLYGPSTDAVIAGYRALTGAAPMYPRWAYGLFQCKERYKTQQELIDIVREFRRRKIPLDCIVQDWFYWNPYPWGSHRLDPKRYPDLRAAARRLHRDLHCRLMISVWAKFVEGSRNYRQLREAGHLYPDYRLPSPAGHRVNPLEAYYDPFCAAGRAMYWRQIDEWLFRKGIDAWWLDATEPELDHTWHGAEREDLVKKHMTGCMSGARTRNAFPLMTTRAVYEGQRRSAPRKRVYILTRSAFAGQQRNAATLWSGDIEATWEVFRNQIVAGINLCLSGIPYWTTDIGAFFVHKYPKGCKDPAYRELFVRWFQFGAFCPVFRVHGTHTPREPWHFGGPGDTVYDTLLSFTSLRYRLLPYIYSLARQVTAHGSTIMRGLVFDFAGDPKARAIGDQFMFGPAFLVCPVTRPAAKNRSVYLPAGTAWYDFWTGRVYRGGTVVGASAPIDKMPLFVRAGSIVLLGPVIQYTDEKPADPLEIRVYPGADGRFVLYEDQGDGWGHERGACATTEFSWDDAGRRFSLGARKGNYPGMLRKRRIRVVAVCAGRATGTMATTAPDADLGYDGHATAVSISGSA